MLFPDPIATILSNVQFAIDEYRNPSNHEAVYGSLFRVKAATEQLQNDGLKLLHPKDDVVGD